MALALRAGELDLAFGLPAEGLAAMEANPELTVKSFPVGYQYFGLLNTARPALADRRVRQAIDLGLDRSELVAAIGNGAPATGAFAPYFPFAGKTPRATDPARAAALLDAAGWAAGPDGRAARTARRCGSPCSPIPPARTS